MQELPGEDQTGEVEQSEEQEDVPQDERDDGLEEEAADVAGNLRQCGAGAAPRGALGMLNWFLMISGLVAMRQSYRSADSRKQDET